MQLSDQDIAACKNAGNANNDWGVTQTLLANQGLAVDLPQIRDVFDALYFGNANQEGLWRQERLIGDREALWDLKRRFPLAAVTGRPRRDVDLLI